MKVLDFLDASSIVVDLKSTSKPDVISELCQMLQANGQIKDAAPVVDALMQREKLGSTGIGQGVAIPHGKSDSASKLVGALGVSKRGVNFDALDGEPVNVVFLLVAPPDSAGLHLKALARISRLLKDKFFRQAIKEAKTLTDVTKIIQDEDEF